jgi:hypothetical protein
MFLAEVLAVLRCAEFLLMKNRTKRIHIWFESRAAVAELAKTTLFLVWKHIQGSGKLSECNKVILVWMPRHQGILGKNKQIYWPRKGPLESNPSRPLLHPFNTSEKLIKRQMEVEHQATWDACTGCQQCKTPMRCLLLSRANKLLPTSTLRLRTANRQYNPNSLCTYLNSQSNKTADCVGQ